MRETIELADFWRNHAGEALALCTLTRKTGSAYRNAGAKKIVARTGGACGLLSGGCLEPDIERVVREGWDRLPFIHSFSTMNPEDRLLGYQTGCTGIIDVLCERLPMDGDRDMYLPFGAAPKATGVALSLAKNSLAKRRWAEEEESTTPELYIDPWQVPVHLTVVGCGIDAVPYAEFGRVLGWRLRFLDYRDSLRDNLPGCDVTIAPLADLPGQIPDGAQSAVLLMTHNYHADLALLKALAGRSVGYIGSLGPRSRFEQMKAELGLPLPASWDTILHAPAGLFTGSHTPHSIALSVVAQIEDTLGG